MLSGVGWARMAHAGNAAILIASRLAAGLVSVVMLRGVPHGLKLGLTLLSLAATLFIQAAVGAFSAKGANLMWVHVPLGAALVGLAAHALAAARRLGAERHSIAKEGGESSRASLVLSLRDLVDLHRCDGAGSGEIMRLLGGALDRKKRLRAEALDLGCAICAGRGLDTGERVGDGLRLSGRGHADDDTHRAVRREGGELGHGGLNRRGRRRLCGILD